MSDEEDSDESTPEISHTSYIGQNIDFDELSKSLLPQFSINTWTHDDDSIDDSKFLEDVNEQLQIASGGKVCTTTVVEDVDKLRTWSRIVFKQEKIPEKETAANSQVSVEFDLNESLSDTENFNVAMRNIVDDFISEEVNFETDPNSYDFEEDLKYFPAIDSGGNKIFRFYYLDAHQNLFGNKTIVYLFGKTFCLHSRTYRSCCVAVGPLKRRVYVLPRSIFFNDDTEDVCAKKIEMVREFYDLALKPLRIKEYIYRFVMKRILNDVPQPDPQLFLEVEYLANYPLIPFGIQGNTFSAVYGAKSDCFENFILEKKLKGPCWIDVMRPKRVIKPKTWCSFEFACGVDEMLTRSKLILKTPPLSVLSMHIISDSLKDNHNSAIKLISWAVNKNYDLSDGSLERVVQRSYCGFLAPSEQNSAPFWEVANKYKRSLVRIFDSEVELLTFFMKEYQELDPDIIVAFDFRNQDFHKLISRLSYLKVGEFSKLGRFREVSKHSDLKEFLFNGRLICDMKPLIRDFITFKSLELTDLYRDFHVTSDRCRSSGDIAKLFPMFEWETMFEVIALATNESIYLLKLMMQTGVLQLCINLTKTSGNILSQTLHKGFSNRSEFLLLHAFYERGFILPSKTFTEVTEAVELSGGLVIEPQVGYYDDYVLLMDFQSLYPSIIYEYNLCISHSMDQNKKPIGVIPFVMYNLLKKRQNAQELMNSVDENSFLYLRSKIFQLAVKLCANSIYGCLGLRSFRFSSLPLAQQITKIGREILEDSICVLKNEGFEIIYGDTDSMMVHTKSKDLPTVELLGQQITNLINSKYSFVNLKVDFIFKRLLIQSKKKYGGISVKKNETILKGLDIIRHDQPRYICEMGRSIINYILSDIPYKDKVKKIKKILEQIHEDFTNKRVPKKLLIITKFLSQAPEDYTTLSLNPHAEVAARLNNNTFKKFKKGDAISYVMCYDAINECNFESAFHLSELNSNSNYEIDFAYYLHKVIYPVISRLCQPFADLEIEIRNCLKLQSAIKVHNEKNNFEESAMKFEGCDPFIFECLLCGEQNIIKKQHNNSELPLLKCQNFNCDFFPLKNVIYLKNKLVLTMRQYITKYYCYRTQCNFTKCPYSSLRLPQSFTSGSCFCPVCCKGNMQQTYSEIDLFLQIEYFRQIFLDGISNSREVWITDAYSTLLQKVDWYKLHSGFNTVDLTRLFFWC